MVMGLFSDVDEYDGDGLILGCMLMNTMVMGLFSDVDKVEDPTTPQEKNLMKQVSQLSTSTAADIYVPKTNRHEEELVVLVVVIVVVVLLTTFYSRLTTNIMIL